MLYVYQPFLIPLDRIHVTKILTNCGNINTIEENTQMRTTFRDDAFDEVQPYAYILTA
jgi:hypothetical protein